MTDKILLHLLYKLNLIIGMCVRDKIVFTGFVLSCVQLTTDHFVVLSLPVAVK